MRVKILVKPKSRQSEVLGYKEELLVVKLKAAPIKGKANQELVILLTDYFKKPVEIIKGFKSKRKTVVVYDDVVS